MDYVKSTLRLRKDLDLRVKEMNAKTNISKNDIVNIAVDKFFNDISNQQLLEEFAKLLEKE